MDCKLPNILITGTPGTGKTTLARLIEDQLSHQYAGKFETISVSKIVVDQTLYKTWNKEFEVPEFDEDMVCDALEIGISQGGKIVDFHSCGFFPPDWFDLIVVLRATNTNIYDRLTERGYNEKKIRENIEAEIFNVVYDEVCDSFEKKIVTSKDSNTIEDMQRNLEEIVEFIKSKISYS
jgi:adenylate kinase